MTEMAAQALSVLAEEYASVALFAIGALPAYAECGNWRAAGNAKLRYEACAREFKHLTGRDLVEAYPHHRVS